jgi:hypothetical protein
MRDANRPIHSQLVHHQLILFVFREEVLMERAKTDDHSLPAANHTSPGVKAWQSRAERLTAEYLRAWGLRDPQTIATLSRRWAEAALAPERAASLGEVYRATMRLAAGDMEHWLARLSELACPGLGSTAYCRGLVAIELQSQIDQYPTALLSEHEPPAALLAQLAGAARPVVPTENRLHMPTQSFGPPLSLRLAAPVRQVWKWVCSRLGSRAPRGFDDQVEAAADIARVSPVAGRRA